MECVNLCSISGELNDIQSHFKVCKEKLEKCMFCSKYSDKNHDCIINENDEDITVISSKYNVLSNLSNSNIPQLLSEVLKDDIKKIED